jgi:hypothetical protein
MIAVAREEILDELRGVHGIDVDVKAYQQRTLPVGSCPMEALELPVLEVAEG